MGSHVSRFKMLYLQAAIAFASAVGGELGPMKEMKLTELSALTWVAWTIMAASVLVSVGNTIMASLQKAPEPKPPVVPPVHE
jgi:hypothetical protein